MNAQDDFLNVTEIEFHALTWSVKHLSQLFLAYDCDIGTCILQEEVLINYVELHL